MDTLLFQINNLKSYRFKGWCKIGGVVAILILVSVTSGYAQLSGQVYRDFNGDGIRQLVPVPEPGVGGVTVRAFQGGSSTAVSTVTDATGNYSFGFPAGTQVRLEFSGFPYQSYPGISGQDNASSVQFVTTPATAHFALLDPLMYSSTQQPALVIPHYIAGDAQAVGSNSGSLKTILNFPYTSSGQGQVPDSLATAAQTGTVWGGAYQRQTGTLYNAAFLKRHSSLGPLGLGGIYASSLSGTPTPYLDVRTLVSLSSPQDSLLLLSRGLPADYRVSSIDTTAFRLVGKVGMGGMAFTPDEKDLWFINLYQKTLVRLNVGMPAKPANSLTAADVTSFQLPAVGCTLGEARPWALSYHQGALYVGVTCDGSGTGATRSNLQAFVYKFDLATNQFDANPVLSTTLDYRKGWVHAVVGQSEYWEPWTDSWSKLDTTVLTISGTDTTFRVSRPQPLLSSIQFDSDRALILGLMDRTGHQTGRRQAAVTPGSNLYSGYIGGDLLRAHFSAITSSYVLEANGQSGVRTGSGVGNGQGPGGGEFYALEQYSDGNGTSIQEETSMGALLVVPGSNEVIAAVIEPFTTWSGGLAWFSNQNGSRSKAYELYNSNPVSEGQPVQLQYFGNANGLGAPVAISDPASLQIGNRVWYDKDRDGVQDPDEAPLAGVSVALYDTTGSLYGLTQTDTSGRYSFESPTIESYQTYYIVFGYTGQEPQFNAATKLLTIEGAAYGITQPDNGEGVDPDMNDSDIQLATGLPDELNGYPYIRVSTGGPGQNNPNYDAGFVTCQIEAGADTTVCAGVTSVQLMAAANGLVWTAVGTNPAPATIDAQGLVLGMSTAGTYRFVLSQENISCSDTVNVTVNQALSVQAQSIPGTCINGIAENDGRILLSAFGPGLTYNYSLGDTYNTPLLGSAQSIPDNGIIADTIANPAAEPQSYTVRIFDSSGCTKDLVVTFEHRECNCSSDDSKCLPVKFRILSLR